MPISEAAESSELDLFKSRVAESGEEPLQFNMAQFPISKFPPEVLSLVLQHACMITDPSLRHGLPHLSRLPSFSAEKRPQFTLSTVSVHWRQVLLSTPNIWTVVDLAVNPDTVDKASEILQVFFTRSGNLPLVIGIDFILGADILADAAFDAILRRNTHRIQELYICDASDTWINLLPSMSNLTNLITRGTTQKTAPLTIRSHCSRLTLKSHANLMQLSCSEMTVLHLYDIPIDICLKLLLEFPSLVEYRNRLPAGSEQSAMLPTNPVTFPHMKTFEWSVNTTDPVDVALLKNIRIPTLQGLIWVEENSTRSDEFQMTSARGIFSKNLPSTLTLFYIHNAGINLIHGLPNVECLIISGYDGRGFLDYVFEALTPGSGISPSPESVKPLPKLKSVLVQGNVGPTKLDKDKVLQMLERRFLNEGAVNEEPFLLEFGFKTEWQPQSKEKLKEMIGHGLRVKILEDSKPVDWL